MIDADGEKLLKEFGYGEKLRLELGSALIPLVDPDQGGKLIDIIGDVRRGMSRDLGFLIQPVHLCSSYNLPADNYRICLHQIVGAQVEIEPYKLLAINAGWNCQDILQGKYFKDPAHGWDSVWIDMELEDQAKKLGYAILRPDLVIRTHVCRFIQDNAHKLLGYDDTHQILRTLWETHPHLVDALVPGTMSVLQVQTVLRRLLYEGLSLHPMLIVAETLVEKARENQNVPALVSEIRKVLFNRTLGKYWSANAKKIYVMTLGKNLETLLTMELLDDTSWDIESEIRKLFSHLFLEAFNKMDAKGLPCLLVVRLELRYWVASVVKPLVESVQVFSYSEIPDNCELDVVETMDYEKQ